MSEHKQKPEKEATPPAKKKTRNRGPKEPAPKTTLTAPEEAPQIRGRF